MIRRVPVIGDERGSMRKVYSLSGPGLLRCKELLGTRSADVLPSRYINDCSPDNFDSLDDRDGDVLGRLMVLRTPVRIGDVPGGGKVPLMPVNYFRFVSIKRPISGMYMRRADREILRK